MIDIVLVAAGLLHWAAGAEGRSVVCSADIATVNLDRKSFTFMRSYPNHIPLSENRVRAIGAALGPFQFNRVAWPSLTLAQWGEWMMEITGGAR